MTSLSSPPYAPSHLEELEVVSGGRRIGRLSGVGTQQSEGYCREPGIFPWRVSHRTFCPPPKSDRASLG